MSIFLCMVISCKTARWLSFHTEFCGEKDLLLGEDVSFADKNTKNSNWKLVINSASLQKEETFQENDESE